LFAPTTAQALAAPWIINLPDLRRFHNAKASQVWALDQLQGPEALGAREPLHRQMVSNLQLRPAQETNSPRQEAIAMSYAFRSASTCASGV
jgi:hypothetical protein